MQALAGLTRLGIILFLVLLASSRFPAHAAAPMAKQQAPGYYRFMLGQYEVTALYDGFCKADANSLLGITKEDLQTLLLRQCIDDPHKITILVNAYVVNTGEKLILIDVGGSKSSDFDLGRISENLKSSGYTPEQIDVVLLTHLHPDHVVGLVDAEGKPIYSHAKIYVAKAEHEFWHSSEELPNIPKPYQRYLVATRKLIQSVAAPYIASEQWITFEGDNLPVAEVKAIPTPGHTPGHTSYEITSQGQSIVFLGDIIHYAAVQFLRPDAAVAFDIDPKQAVASRQNLLRRIADNRTRPLVAGPHLPFPGIGRLCADGPSAFLWTPIDYSP